MSLPDPEKDPDKADVVKGPPVGVPGGTKALRPKETIDSALRQDEIDKFHKLLGDASSIKEETPSRTAPVGMIADDDPQVRSYVSKILKLLHFECIEAVSGAETLKLTLQHRPDLLILDLSMPGMDGYEVLRGVRNYLRFTQMLIIVLTGVAGQTTEVSTLSLGADDHLTKPIDRQRLEAKLTAFARRLRSGRSPH